MKRAIGFAALALLALAGCKKSEQPPDANQEVNMQEPLAPAPGPVAPTDVPPPSKPVPESNLSMAIPDEDEKPSADQQMREDAEATGMTSRVARDEAPAADTIGGATTNQQ